MWKLFEDGDIVSIPYPERRDITLSQDSPCASHIAFFTGIKSLGTINSFDTNSPPSLALKIPTEIKYQWNFDKTVLPNASLTAERISGVFLTSTADQSYRSSSNNQSKVKHQSVFDHIKGYLYRPDNNYSPSTTALFSSSSSESISVARLISVRKDMFHSTIEPSSFKMEMNISNTSSTGIVTGTSTAYVSALDLKNPNGGIIGTNVKSFFGVPWAINSSLDTATSAITIETIIRPYKPNSVLLWRRLSSSGWSGSTTESQNAFMKFELTKSPDNRTDAFRFYIRSTSAAGDFSEGFAKNDIQASGLFVPNDVGINLFDGNFHHLIVSWSCTGVDGSLTIESGAGAVFGYIDGYKLTNVEQTDPRLEGADAAKGPAIQTNMFRQRIPIRRSPISYGDPLDSAPNGNNLYIGVSNFNRPFSEIIGDRGTLTTSADPYLVGGYDGQIQHFRIWNRRFSDGSTGLLADVNTKVPVSSTAGMSFNYFADPALTGQSISTSIVAWWNFNEINALTSDDVSTYSNTGSLVGRASINLYDIKDKSISSITINVGDDVVNSGITRNFLYVDVPQQNIIQNDLTKGRIIRRAADGTTINVGTIFYDSGSIVLDGRDKNAKIDFLYPASGTTGDWGFSVTANNSALNVERISFKSVENKGRIIFNAIAEGNEFNYTQNPAGINPENNNQLLDEPATYVTTVGLYDENGELLIVSKLSKPIRKDNSRKVIFQIRADL